MLEVTQLVNEQADPKPFPPSVLAQWFRGKSWEGRQASWSGKCWSSNKPRF